MEQETTQQGQCCTQCGKPNMVVESAPDGKTKKIKCLSCGFQLTQDTQGRKLLTEVLPSQSASPTPAGRQLLVEG